MNNQNNFIKLAILPLLFSYACTPPEKGYDASGSFEAIERVISAEATGKIEYLTIEEGQVLNVGDTIGKINVSNLLLQSEQIKASVHAIHKKTHDAAPQVAILKSQLGVQKSQTAAMEQQIVVLDKEISRFQNLVNANAVPKKQLDDLLGQKSILQKQLEAAQTQTNVIQAQITAAQKNVNLQNRSILSEIEPNNKRLDLIKKQINDGIIVNEFPGTVTTQFAYDGEFTSIGKPIYKIADLSKIILRTYVSGNQLAQIKLNDPVSVLTDDGNGGFNETEGIISWISSKGEFTPKTIQTKEERVNMVYAIKIKVVNDGRYKIGMYGEVKFKDSLIKSVKNE